MLCHNMIAISDGVGNPVVRQGYGTYGETDPAQMVGTTSAGSTAHPFGYTGRRYDPDLGLYYYRARWYDPSLGTFLQTDPIGSLDYINLYAYVGLEPGNAADPTGMHVECVTNAQGGQTCTIRASSRAEYVADWLHVAARYQGAKIVSIWNATVRPPNSTTPGGNVVRGHGGRGNGEQYLEGKGWTPGQVDDIIDAPANSYQGERKDKYSGSGTRVHEDGNGNWVVVNGKGEVIQVNDRDNPRQPKPKEKQEESQQEPPRNTRDRGR
jgi:RHS repeat-associated protein